MFKLGVLCFICFFTGTLSFADQWDDQDDLISDATVLIVTANAQSHGSHTLSTNDVADWFSFDLEAGKRYRFQSIGIQNEVDGWLYSDPAGTAEVAANKDSGVSSDFQILYVPLVSQTYYLKVDNYYHGAASYMLEYQEEPLFDQWDSVDDSVGGATELSVFSGEQRHGPHSLSISDHVDWFRFPLVAGCEYEFAAVNGGWDTVGALYLDGTTEVASGDDEGELDNKLNFIITYTPTVTGDYYLKVHGYDEGSELNYTLKYGSNGSADLDGDGLPDAWEIQYFGHITNGFPYMHSDSDLFMNIDEYIAGTDPTNSASYFAVTNFSLGSFVLQWPAVPNREYRVYWTDSLTNSFIPLGSPIDYPVNSYTDTDHNAESAGFYKVDVRLK